MKQVATADRFLSQSLPRDFAVDAGQYTFQIGDKSVSLNWRGGTLKAFADAINAKGGALLSPRWSMTRRARKSSSLKASLPGSSNRLTFLDSAIDMGVKSGMLQRSATASRAVTIDQKTPTAWTTPLAPDGFQVQNGTLIVNPGQELKIPVSPSVALNPNMVLEMSVKVEKIPPVPVEEAKPPPGPTIPGTGESTIRGSTSTTSRRALPFPSGSRRNLPRSSMT